MSILATFSQPPTAEFDEDLATRASSLVHLATDEESSKCVIEEALKIAVFLANCQLELSKSQWTQLCNDAWSLANVIKAEQHSETLN